MEDSCDSADSELDVYSTGRTQTAGWPVHHVPELFVILKLQPVDVNSQWARFPDPVLAELHKAGWSPDRVLDISTWVSELAAQGYRISDVAAAGLASFGGFELGPVNISGPNFSNDEPLNVEPILAGSGHRLLAEELEAEVGGNWYPFGEWLSSVSVFVRDDGWVVATGLGWIWELGDSVEEAVEFALMAHHPLKCLKVLSPGGKPWPSEDVDLAEGESRDVNPA
jgi:hypothetical protein